MIKKKFKIILLFLIFFCSGCNIKYSVAINDATFYENIIVDSIKKNDNNFLSVIEILFQGTLYDVKQYDDGTIRTNYFWPDITTYRDGSLLFMKLVDSNSISLKGNKVYFDIKMDESLSELITSLGGIGDLEISIYIPYYVSKHNADKVSDNTYIWIIDDVEKDSIKIKFDMSKNVNYKNKIFSIITIVVLVIAITWIVIYFIKRNKEANEI